MNKCTCGTQGFGICSDWCDSWPVRRSTSTPSPQWEIECIGVLLVNAGKGGATRQIPVSPSGKIVAGSSGSAPTCTLDDCFVASQWEYTSTPGAYTTLVKILKDGVLFAEVGAGDLHTQVRCTEIAGQPYKYTVDFEVWNDNKVA